MLHTGPYYSFHASRFHHTEHATVFCVIASQQQAPMHILAAASEKPGGTYMQRHLACCALLFLQHGMHASLW